MGIISAISNYKGGVGKTITAINLSTALAIKRKKVLLIDIDPQSDSTRALLHRQRNVDKCVYNLLDEDEKAFDIRLAIYPTIHEKLWIMPNITDTSGLEIPLAQRFPDSNLFLRNAAYEYIKENFDFVFIDCPPTLSIFVSNALHCADCVIIPIDAGSGNSLQGVRGVLDMMKSIQMTGNPNLRFLKILINKVDRRKSAHRANMQEAHVMFGSESVFENSIPTSTLFEITESVTRATIFSRNPSSKAANGFRAVAKEFLELFEP